MEKFICLLMLLLLSACFPLTGNTLNKIKVGDSKEEVVRVLGNPYSKKANYNKTFMVYYVHDSFFEVFFSRRFPYIGFFPFTRTGREFWVVVENNKVVSFGDSVDFQDFSIKKND